MVIALPMADLPLKSIYAKRAGKFFGQAVQMKRRYRQWVSQQVCLYCQGLLLCHIGLVGRYFQLRGCRLNIEAGGKRDDVQAQFSKEQLGFVLFFFPVCTLYRFPAVESSCRQHKFTLLQICRKHQHIGQRGFSYVVIVQRFRWFQAFIFTVAALWAAQFHLVQ